MGAAKEDSFTACGGKPGYKRVYLSDPVKKARHAVSVSVRKSLIAAGSSKKGRHVFDYLPYTPQELKEHLESLFEYWMTWDNYGGPNDSPEMTWQIDHIKPHSSFQYTSMSDPPFLECWSLSNLRPLEKRSNMAKGSKII